MRVSPDSLQRVVLVVESPFARRDEIRFGVRELMEAGLSVEVWDICDLTLPLARRQWIAPALLVNAQLLGRWSEVDALARTLSTGDAVILLCGVHGRLDELHAPLLSAVLGSPAIVGAIASGTIPPPRRLDRFRGMVIWAIKTAVGWERPSVKPLRPLDYLWAGVTTKGIAKTLIGASTVIRYLHTLDYDLVLNHPKMPEKADDFVVFLDTMGPLHPDYVSQREAIPWRLEEYRELMAAAFDAIEETGLHIVVAAHPRAAPGSLEPLYPDRDVRHGLTAELIRHCTYVLTLDGSTSIGIAAVLGQPILFLDDPVVPVDVRSQASRFRHALGGPVVQVRGRSKPWRVPKMNEMRAREYVRRYVKRADTPEVPFWSSVAMDLKLEWDRAQLHARDAGNVDR